MSELVPSGRFLVSLDDERELVWRFADREAAITFAHVDSQLEGSNAVVMERHDDGSFTVIATVLR